jgi:hypothetical protein
MDENGKQIRDQIGMNNEQVQKFFIILMTVLKKKINK